MDNETGRIIPDESDYKDELPREDGILSESSNTQDGAPLPEAALKDVLETTPEDAPETALKDVPETALKDVPETTLGEPSKPKRRRKPRPAGTGSEGAVTRRRKKPESGDPASADAPVPAKKDPDGETDAGSRAPAVRKKKKRPAGSGSTSVSVTGAEAQTKEHPAAKKKSGNKARRPAAAHSPQSEEVKVRKKKTDTDEKQLPARTGKADTTEVALIPKPEDREAALIRETGLTAEEVRYRVQEGEVNLTVPKGHKSVGRIIASHTLTYFNLLNIALAVLVILTGQIKNVLFLGTCISNTLIGIIQELRVKSLIDKLSVITMTKVNALRDGASDEIPVNEIVRDDILLVAAGDQIVTDGSVYDCQGLEVNESMLTGESKPIRKKDGDKILSGSFITAGTARMQVEKIGNECYASELVSKASHKKRASSEMQRSIGRIIKFVSIMIIPVGLLLYRSQLAAAGGNSDTAIIKTVSGVIGMIPEGLVLLTSVSFIIGIARLARKQALVQEMAAIESLARTNIICTDKTGTITTGDLRIQEIIALDETPDSEIDKIISHMNGAFSDTNATQKAVDEHFGRRTDWPVRETIPFSSARKYKAAGFESHGDYCIGAPEYLVPDNTKVLDLVADFSKQGYRVLLLGRSTGISAEAESIGTVTPVAVIVISDVIKEDAKKTFAYFAKSGVDVKVLSGDNPVTVSTVAVKAGVKGGEKYVDATTLPKDPILLAQEIAKYNVFGRVKPEQKQAFVKAWQANGKTVAMIGDGVNDVLAIKDADCGIAMASGSEAAKQAAHIVLLDSDFASMKEIVREGRVIIANIERVSSLYLTKTLYSAMLSVIFILLSLSYPFSPLQMGLINMCCIGLPSFLLTLEKPEKVTSDGFLPHVLKTSLPASLTMVAAMLIVQLLNALFGWQQDIFSTFSMMLAGLVAMLVVADVCWPLVPYRKIVLTVCISLFAACVLLLPRFYDMHSIFMWWSLLLIPLMILVMMMIYWFSRLTNKLMLRVMRQRERAGRI